MKVLLAGFALLSLFTGVSGEATCRDEVICKPISDDGIDNTKDETNTCCLHKGETNCKQCLVVRPGNLNIILALPHGGGFKPNSYLNRTYGCYSSNGTTCEYNHDCNPDPENCTDRCCESDAILTSDYRSNEIAYKIHDHILSTTRRCPTIIMNILHRSWLDPNRYDDDGLATFREEVAEKIYTWYHGNMTALVAKLNGFGIIFDMHGYYNSLVNWTIIGSMMSENSLKDVNLDSRANDSSLKSLVARTGETLSNLLQGPNSLGAYIEDGIVNNKTIEAVPSDTNLHPDGKKYFAAASSPITNGHRDNIDVLQIEMHKNYRDNLVDRALHQNEYAAALGNAFLNFYTRYYDGCVRYPCSGGTSNCSVGDDGYACSCSSVDTCPATTCAGNDADTGVQQATKSPIKTTYDNGECILYICNDGYVHTSGDLARTCENGSWSEPAPTCTDTTSLTTTTTQTSLITTTTPTTTTAPTTTTTTTTLTTTTTPTTTTAATTASTTTTITTTAIEVTCAAVTVDHADREPNKDPYNYDEEVTYSCKTGSEHYEGDLKRKCQADGTWTGKKPKCLEKWKCYDFTSLEETAVNVAEAADFLNLVNSEMVVCNLVPLYRWYDGCGYCDHHCCIDVNECDQNPCPTNCNCVNLPKSFGCLSLQDEECPIGQFIVTVKDLASEYVDEMAIYGSTAFLAYLLLKKPIITLICLAVSPLLAVKCLVIALLSGSVEIQLAITTNTALDPTEAITTALVAGNHTDFAVRGVSKISVYCEKGEYRDDVSNECFSCPNGTYSDTTLVTRCNPCLPGFYQDEEGKSQCKRCSPGTFSLAVGSDSCSPCPVGMYSSAEGSTNCTQCSPGTVAETQGQPSCIACNPGTSPNVDMSGCENCSAGSYSANGMECLQCEDGSVSSGGQPNCTECNAGTEPNEQKSECRNCSAGLYSPSGVQCLPCANGNYSTPASAYCIPCPAGYVPNSSQSECNPCPPGNWSNSGDHVCRQCEEGSFSPGGQPNCTECDAGTVPNKERSACQNCSAGFNSSAGDATCSSCPRDLWSPPGSEFCNVCELGVMPLEDQTGCVPNIAFNKTTEQKSKKYNSGNAVDGDFYNTCSRTKKNRKTWWKVILGGWYSVRTVAIQSTEDCCGDELRDLVVSVKQKGKPIICGKYTGPAVAGERIYVTCDPPIVGRRVKIEKTTKGNKAALVLCEVFVEGIPADRPKEDNGSNDESENSDKGGKQKG